MGAMFGKDDRRATVQDGAEQLATAPVRISHRRAQRASARPTR